MRKRGTGAKSGAFTPGAYYVDCIPYLLLQVVAKYGAGYLHCACEQVTRLTIPYIKVTERIELYRLTPGLLDTISPASEGFER